MRYALHKRLYLAVILSLLLCSFVTHHVHADSPSAFKTFQLIAFDELSGNPDPSTGDDFGHSIAVSGDTAVVGAPASGMGAAHVYRFDGNTWKQEVILTASNGGFFNGFGRSAAISGNTIIIGAPFDSESGFFSGAVYVFAYDGTTWNQEDKLTASDSSPVDGFGLSLAIENDIILVGTARGGRAYVFRSDGSTWLEEAKLPATDDGSGTLERFGWSVAISGDTAVVGAPGDSDAGPDSGSAYVFKFDGSEWVQEAKLTASDAAASDEFGYSVAVSGDTVVVGAHKDADAGTNSGSAYVFGFDGKLWGEKAKLTASDAAADEEFGYTIALSGDTLVVGAPFSTNEGISAGAAYVFKKVENAWHEENKLTTSDGSDGDQFGLSTAIDGKTLVVGSPLADVVDPNDPTQNLMVPDAGAAYAFVFNQPPVAVASWDPQEGIVEGDPVTLDGSGSYDPDDDQLTYEWVQTAGPEVDLNLDLALVLAAENKKNPAVRTFVAPELSEGCDTLTFQLTVTEDVDGGLSSAPPATVKITVSPNNTIHSELERKHRHRLYGHKYTFEGVKDQVVTLDLKADPDGLYRGKRKRATLILKDEIRGVRFYKKDKKGLPNTITATLPADGKYVVYVLKQPGFRRGKNFRGDYILTLEGTCGKLNRTSRFRNHKLKTR